ncbi:hypothetical protein ABK040_005737 [Willaertia magna]
MITDNQNNISDKTTTTGTDLNKSENKPKYNILIIDAENNNWDKIFESLNNNNIEIEQTTWDNIASVISYNESSKKQSNSFPVNHKNATKKCEITLKPYKSNCEFNKKRNTQRQCYPNLVIVRKLVQGLKINEQDYTNHLLGMMHCQLPAINNLTSIFINLNRPIIQGILSGIRDKVGVEKFPLIDQYFFSEPHRMLFTPNASKVVLKVGSAEAGFGKVLYENNINTIRDFTGCITRYGDFITCEPFIQNRKCDLRLQKIGKHLRLYERINSNWKGNVGNSVIKEIENIPKRYKKWIKYVDKAFKEQFGVEMDIYTIDAIQVLKEENIIEEYILEINDSASGFYNDNKEEDMKHVAELAINKLSQL